MDHPFEKCALALGLAIETAAYLSSKDWTAKQIDAMKTKVLDGVRGNRNLAVMTTSEDMRFVAEATFRKCLELLEKQ